MPVLYEIRALLLAGRCQTKLILLPEDNAMRHLPEYQVEFVFLFYFSFLSTILKVKSDKFLPEIPWSDSLEYYAQHKSIMMIKEDLFNYFPLYFTSLHPHFSLLYVYFVYLFCQIKMHLSYLGFWLEVMQEVFRTAIVCILFCYHCWKWLNIFIRNIKMNQL